MAIFGDFPGVRVETSRGGVSSVAVGVAEKVIVFGEGLYDASNNVDGDASASTPRQINAPLEADTLFGADSELAEGMQEALQNGANIDFLHGVAVPRTDVTAESQGAQTGSLDNVEIVEDTDSITVEDMDGGGTSVATLDVEFRYAGAPSSPSESDTVFINPLTGEYAADSGPSDHFEFDYTVNDYETAFNDEEVRGVVNENETGVLWALTDSDAVSSQLDTVVSTLRDNYQLVTGFAFAEPNDQITFDAAETTAENGGSEPRYDAANYDSANQSVNSNSFFKLAPGRVDGDADKTIGGGLAGLYAGKPIDDAVYNEAVSGFTALQQKLNKTEADALRDEDLIPIRSGGSIRVKGNRATSFSEPDSVAADFFTRRITDRVILIVKQVGDQIIGQINNAETRAQTQQVINSELGRLAADGIIKPNAGDENNFNVQVFEDSTNKNEVNVDVQFTPQGIVKRIDASVTVDV
jgi:hypothetical protein